MRSFLRNRFERKYLLTEADALKVRRAILPRVSPDEHLRPGMDRGYPVYSLYMDSPDLALYRSAAVGHKNRFKLRIRYYDDRDTSPIFCEIKKRVDQTISKQRAGLHREALQRILAGHGIPDRLLLKPATERRDIEDFLRRQHELRALPTLLVGYNREAYLDESTGDARLTFDRDLRAAAFDPERGLHTDLPPVRSRAHHVIFEIKYVNRFPRWLQDLVHLFHLERVSVPKYGWSVEAFGEERVARHARRPRPLQYSA